MAGAGGRPYANVAEKQSRISSSRYENRTATFDWIKQAGSMVLFLTLNILLLPDFFNAQTDGVSRCNTDGVAFSPFMVLDAPPSPHRRSVQKTRSRIYLSCSSVIFNYRLETPTTRIDGTLTMIAWAHENSEDHKSTNATTGPKPQVFSESSTIPAHWMRVEHT
jgi:hypothetical protein